MLLLNVMVVFEVLVVLVGMAMAAYIAGMAVLGWGSRKGSRTGSTGGRHE